MFTISFRMSLALSEHSIVLSAGIDRSCCSRWSNRALRRLTQVPSASLTHKICRPCVSALLARSRSLVWTWGASLVNNLAHAKRDVLCLESRRASPAHQLSIIPETWPLQFPGCEAHLTPSKEFVPPPPGNGLAGAFSPVCAGAEAVSLDAASPGNPSLTTMQPLPVSVKPRHSCRRPRAVQLLLDNVSS